MTIAIEKQIKQETVFSGKVLRVTLDTVRINDTTESFREVVHHMGAAAVIPVMNDGRVVLVRQYRYALEQAILEIPAGKLDPNESPATCAIRELEEEAGFHAEELIDLGPIFTTPGFSNEVVYLYLARNMTETAQHLDEDEFVEVEYYTIDEIYHMIEEGLIRDGKTIAAFAKARRYLVK